MRQSGANCRPTCYAGRPLHGRRPRNGFGEVASVVLRTGTEWPNDRQLSAVERFNRTCRFFATISRAICLACIWDSLTTPKDRREAGVVRIKAGSMQAPGDGPPRKSFWISRRIYLQDRSRRGHHSYRLRTRAGYHMLKKVINPPAGGSPIPSRYASGCSTSKRPWPLNRPQC